MRSSAIVVLCLSAIAIALYWTPIVIDLGGSRLVLGGYPWLKGVGEEVRTRFFYIGLAITAFFAAASLIMVYIVRQSEQLRYGYVEESEETEELEGIEEGEGELEW